MAEVEPWESAFAEAAAQDGIVLEPATFVWASEPGHLAVEHLADQTGDMDIMQRAEVGVPALDQMFNRLKGLVPVLHAGRLNMPYAAVLLHEPTGTLVEVDHALHFTTARLHTLDLYPGEVKVGYDIKAFKELCREHAPKSDKWRYGLASKTFGFHGLQSDRAYQDAVRDIAAWVMGFPPLMRFAAIDEDGEAAYAGARETLLDKLKP